MYKIKGVKVIIKPQQTMSATTVQQGNAWANKKLYTAIDTLSVISPTTVDQIREYQNCRESIITKPHTRYFRPQIIDSGGKYNPGSKWISTDQIDLQHYSLLLAIEAPQTISPTVFEFSYEVIYYLAFKNVR